jgi:hypothetical protein
VVVQQTAAAASDLTRAADAALVSARVKELGEIVGAAGVVDVEEGVDMIMKGGDVKAMGAIVKLMSKEELGRGLELARLAGELWTVSDVTSLLDMPVLAEFLEERGAEIAVDRYYAIRARGRWRARSSGQRHRAMGENEVVEGCAVRCLGAVSGRDVCRQRRAGRGLTNDDGGHGERRGGDTAQTGVAEIAQGAEEMGAGEATEAMGEALEERASR